MKTIVWDLDDVLNTFTESWLELAWRDEHPDCKISYGKLHSNPPLSELNTTIKEYTESLDRFRLSSMAASLQPNPAVLAWFRRDGTKFHHHVLTARPIKMVAPAAAWVFQHFGTSIRHFHFVPSARTNDPVTPYPTSKADVLATLGPVDFFIDDSAVNVAGAAQLGIKTFLFPQPWNDAELGVGDILSELSAGANFEAALI